MSSSRVVTTVAVVVVSLATSFASGCKAEDTRLFDETGVWTLEKFTLDGSPYQDITQGRKNRFLLRFMPTPGIEPPDLMGGLVAAASCHEMGTMIDIKGSTCVNAGLSTWDCQCFAYTFEESKMVWQEFDPGQPPPVVGVPPADDEGGAEFGDAHAIEVSAFGSSSSTFEFYSLPAGLFNSDGENARHVFQLKADSVWTDVDINGDDVPDLDECSASCFP
ncbi:hypothetical protein DB30_01070 [Enhygromyxa salina]|uniref:Lipoprotein n=1 Tax=Enhygromyxa salina TaxID=215803 RepID=A0A0C2CY29_9BACT|nr:hypothetical protein [Enhygromyxa salina]KIG12712.1 hypothetical protein DB30_01070 [Enhygromyxa salina]